MHLVACHIFSGVPFLSSVHSSRSIDVERFAATLARHLRDGNSVCFFLGAGCSRKGGVPTSEELMQLWEIEGIERGTYFRMLERRYPLATAADAAFRALNTKASPTSGHHALANMFAAYSSQVKLCLTTNFDGLIESAVGQRNMSDGNTRSARTFFQQTDARTMRHTLSLPNVFGVVKLHGDALAGGSVEAAKSTDVCDDLTDPVRTQLHAKPTILVFIGYSGNDNNVVRWLRKLEVDPHSVFWCSKAEPVGLISPWLRENAYVHVAHEDFDEIMGWIGRYERESVFFV